MFEVVAISLHWSRFDIRPVGVRFVIDNVALAQIFI